MPRGLSTSRCSRFPAVALPFVRVGKRLRSTCQVVAMQIAAGPNGYARDGITTRHNASFVEDDQFKYAYKKAVEAAGWDYGVEWRLHQALWAARTSLNVPGDFVELGTGRGFIMVGVLHGLGCWPQEGRKLWLFDTFKSGRIDASGQHGSVPSPHYAASYEDTEGAFSDWENVRLIQGWLPDSLHEQRLESISFLHVDLNHPTAEVESLRLLWDKVNAGGIILLDDYAYRNHQEQHEAMNSLAAELRAHILTTPTGQGIIVKPG